MADQYVIRRVQQVLRKANGDVAVAQQLLVRLCEFDTELMKRLVSPYLPAIVARSLSPAGSDAGKARNGRSASGGASVVHRRPSANGANKAPLPETALDAVVSQMAQHIGENKSPRGMTALVKPAEKTSCSPRHRKAVEELISAYAR